MIIKDSSLITLEEVKSDYRLANFVEGLDFLEKNDSKILFPEKYLLSLKRIATNEIKALYSEDPNLPAKQVVIHIFKGLNDNLTTELLLEMTSFVLSKWSELSGNTFAEA